MPRLDRVRDQPQHGRRELVEELRHEVVAPVHGERVLRQVVRADGEEVHVRRKPGGHERDGRHLDHDADRDVVGDGVALGAEAGAGFEDHAPEGAHLVHVRHHRDEDADGPEGARAEDRAELRLGEVGLVEQHAHAAPAEKRVGLAVGERQHLVAAEVEHAKRGAARTHVLGDLLVDRVLLLFGERQAPPHEHQDLGAEQAHALGAVALQQFQFLLELQVGAQRHPVAVERLGGEGHELALLRDQPFVAAAAAFVEPHRRRRRGGDHAPEQPVEHNRLAVLDVARDVFEADHGGQAQRARHDGHVARGAAVLEGEALDAAPGEQHHVGGGERRGHHDDPVVHLRDHLAAPQVHEQALFEVGEVGGAVAETLAIGGEEQVAVVRERLVDGVVGAHVVGADERHDGVVEAGVAQHERLRLEDGRVLVAQFFPRERRHLLQVALGAFDGHLEALEFGGRLFSRDAPLLDRLVVARVQVHRRHHDPRRHRDAVEDDLGGGRRERHLRRPRRSLRRRAPGSRRRQRPHPVRRRRA